MDIVNVRPHVVQQAVVLLHFDERFAATIASSTQPSWLTAEEIALLRRTDPRAFRTDPERPLRLLAVLLEEFPVSCAIVGRDRLREFISSELFHGAIRKGRLVVDAFGDWLFPRAGGIAQLEQAVALARRRRPRRGQGFARAPGVELARVPAGTLIFYVDARKTLGATPHEAVAQGRTLAPPADGPGLESLLVEAEREEAGQQGPSVAPCADELSALLSFARDGRSQAELIDEALHLGAGEDAAEVVDGLITDGLLAAVEDR